MGGSSNSNQVAHTHSQEDPNDLPLRGIIEDSIPEAWRPALNESLTAKMEHMESVSEEVWLDALVTVLEECGAIRDVQELFLAPAMVKPRTNAEEERLEKAKIDFERRLNVFLGLLEQEARLQHLTTLSAMAKAKERVLKQQGLVLLDYLETLDKQIENVQLEKKNLE